MELPDPTPVIESIKKTREVLSSYIMGVMEVSFQGPDEDLVRLLVSLETIGKKLTKETPLKSFKKRLAPDH